MKPQNMTSSDSVIEQRKAFQPFVDVFPVSLPSTDSVDPKIP